MSNQSHSNHTDCEEAEGVSTPLLTVADFNGDGEVNFRDIRDLALRYDSSEGDDLYHPLYDLNADREIDGEDIIRAITSLGEDVPLLDRQIAQATQATMRYYGSDGLENAIADGYIPITQEALGHGTHYGNLSIFLETRNSEQVDLTRPVGLNYDAEGNLIAVFYLREPITQEATPENPLAPLLIDPNNDFPPDSFDGLSDENWHQHRSTWTTNFGNLNSEAVYFEEDVPIEGIVSRVEAADFQFYPESDLFYSPKVWMLHGWFHSLNPNGTFAITNPNIAPYAVEELGAHGEHHAESELILGTEAADELFGDGASSRFNGFSGDDLIAGGLGDDSIWGSHGNDLLRGDEENSLEGGDDMVYGGPGSDLIYGQNGSDRLFGGTEDDEIYGGAGDDLLRGGLGNDLLAGDSGNDSFVLVANEGEDRIIDFEIDEDLLILYGGIATEDLSIFQMGDSTAIEFNGSNLAILENIDAHELIAANDDVFLSV